MFKPKKLLAFISTFLLLALNPLVFAEDQITITTYYPSPYGSYNYLQTDKLGVGDNSGDGNLNSDDVPTTTGDVWIKGDVGIGTINPSRSLHVWDGFIRVGSDTKYLETQTNGSYVDIRSVGATLALNWGSSQNVTLLDSGTGKVGIGTAGPLYKLDVSGDTHISGQFSVTSLAVSPGISVEAGSGVGVNAFGNYGVQGSGPYAGVRGYGTSAVSGGGIGVFGSGFNYDFLADGSGIDYGVASSIRWKKNVKELSGSLDTIMKLNGVSFDWDKEHGGGHGIGFIGEEVGKYYPEIVSFDEKSENPKYYVTGMDYSKMTPVLLEAVKELKQQKDKQIEELQNRVASQQKVIEGLQKEVKEISNYKGGSQQ